MKFTAEKNEQYALIRLSETTIGGAIATDLDTLCRNLFREGYTNIILDIATVETVEADGLMMLRKINHTCANDNGLLVLATKNDDLIEAIDRAGGTELTLLPTVEEAVDAVYMNELENEFRSETDDEYDHGEHS